MFSLFKIFAYALVALAGVALLAVLKHRIRQRSLQRIPGPSNPSLFWGHWRHMFNPYAYPFHDGLYRTYGKVTRVYGFLGDIQLVVSDPMACNHIIVKDQAIFELTEAILRVTKQVLSELCENFWSTVSNGPEEIDIADWMGKLALELIGQAGLGYSFGTLEGRMTSFPNFVLSCGASKLVSLRRQGIPPQNSQVPGECVTVAEIEPPDGYCGDPGFQVEGYSRDEEKLLELGDDATVRQVGDGNDIISILMRASVTGPEDDRLSDEELVSQMAIFLIAATNTTTSALSRILHLLALHPDVQDRLRKELKELVSLPFWRRCVVKLCACKMTVLVIETYAQRPHSYAPVPGVIRTTKSDVVLPLSAPIQDVDGCKVHEIFVPKNTNVFVQIYHLNRDPSIWGTDAAEWKPERWLAPLPQSVADAKIQGVYANTMTFIGGSRACIGFKFSQLEMKVVLSRIIPAFRLAPSGAEIVWRFGSISTPSVKGSVETFHPKLPIMVSRI
ncbi:cytochrome P450 [Lactarius psammicola]|nr:cytochrome P450 [Lactarius psammicola]